MKRSLLLISACIISNNAFTQLAINTLGTPVTIDFTGFSGLGFQPGGGVGMLNSNDWSATGFTDGDLAFGGTAMSGDFARGAIAGGVINGGIYSLDVAGNQMLWVQPAAGDFTPGNFKLKIINNTPDMIGQLSLSYSVLVLNDEERANNFNCSYSMDDLSYTNIPALDLISDELADFIMHQTDLSFNITGISIAPGDNFYLSWTGDDVTGGGSRDEFGIDDISLTANVAATFPAYNFIPAEMTVNEGDLVASFDISLSESEDCTMHFGYGAAATATPGFDYGLTGFTLGFIEGGPTTQTVDFGLVDDLIAEGTETGIIFIGSVDGTCIAGADTAVVITIEDNELVTPPIVSFTTIGATELENIGTVSGTIGLTEPADCEIQMYLDGATIMTAGTDYIFSLPANFTFTAAGATTQSFDVEIINDFTIETDEMLLMNLTVISGTCAMGPIADFEINIIDDDDIIIPTFDIAEVTEEDADGIALSDGLFCSLTGIVYGINTWDGGLQFTLIDATGGINVFSFAETFGYTVTEGDEVTVIGTITQFNGLTEIEPDTVIFNLADNTLKLPTDVTTLSEDSESDLLELNQDMTEGFIINESQWLGDGSSFNVECTKGTDTIIIRIDNNTD
ncbi:MAG: Calx-beta domain-containing protein, partial [Chitinophagales bacterium]